MPVPIYGMESKRILLSNNFYHSVDLTEQSIGVILHALLVLSVAFAEEPEYLAIIQTTYTYLGDKLDEDAEAIPEP